MAAAKKKQLTPTQKMLETQNQTLEEIRVNVSYLEHQERNYGDFSWIQGLIVIILFIVVGAGITLLATEEMRVSLSDNLNCPEPIIEVVEIDTDSMIILEDYYGIDIIIYEDSENYTIIKVNFYEGDENHPDNAVRWHEAQVYQDGELAVTFEMNERETTTITKADWIDELYVQLGELTQAELSNLLD